MFFLPTVSSLILRNPEETSVKQSAKGNVLRLDVYWSEPLRLDT
jgi:hypothetical protein